MTRIQTASRNVAITLTTLAAPIAAMAHTGNGGAHTHDFVSGFVHPLTGLDHLSAMVMVGLWSALALRRAWVAPLAFAAMLLLGALAGLQGWAVPGVEPMIAVSLLALGLLTALRQRLPAALAALLVAVFAVFHGTAHGSELAGSPDATAMLAGMLCATVLLHGIGMAAGARMRGANPWLPRAAGAGVALFGLALLAGVA